MEETTPRRNCGLKGPCAHGGGPLTGGRGMATHAYILKAAEALSTCVPTSLRTADVGDSSRQLVRPHGGTRNTAREGASALPTHRHRNERGSLHRLPSDPPVSTCENRRRLVLHRMHGSQTLLLSSTYISQRAARPVNPQGMGSRSIAVRLFSTAPHRGNPGARGRSFQ